MYRHIKQYEIRYTDADAHDRLKLSSLLSFLEESACLSADELGFGYEVIMPKNMGFIIVNSYIQLFKPICLGDVVEVHTWPLRPKHLIFLRDYEIYCNGEKVGVATTRWCMIDTKKYTMLPVSVFFKEDDFVNYNTERSVEFTSWKIPAVENAQLCYSKRVTYSDYDHYFHVNNTKYADFLTDSFAVEEFKNKFIGKAQITYVKQCKIGELIDLYRQSNENVNLVEGRVGDELRVQFRIELDEV